MGWAMAHLVKHTGYKAQEPRFKGPLPPAWAVSQVMEQGCRCPSVSLPLYLSPKNLKTEWLSWPRKWHSGLSIGPWSIRSTIQSLTLCMPEQLSSVLSLSPPLPFSWINTWRGEEKGRKIILGFVGRASEIIGTLKSQELFLARSQYRWIEGGMRY